MTSCLVKSLEVYHGGEAGTSQFKKFSSRFLGSYWTPEKDIAIAYSEKADNPAIYSTRLDLEGMADLSGNTKAFQVAIEAYGMEGVTFTDFIDEGGEVWMLLENTPEGREVVNSLADAGFKGAIIPEEFSLTYVVFSPDQLEIACHDNMNKHEYPTSDDYFDDGPRM